MRWISINATILCSILLLLSCGGGESTPQKNTNTHVGTLPPLSGPNVLRLTVNGSTCAANTYLNKPCVSLQICTPGTSNCQTIDDILVDTGSVGLRVFKSLLNVPLNPVVNNSQPLAECVQFGDGSSDWGPVQTADVILGGEPAVTVPIHVIDSSFGDVTTHCYGANTTPKKAGYNGILGVGLFTADCGEGCVTKPYNRSYYTCTGTTCVESTAPLTSQVTNPVALLPKDNNGVIIELPEMGLGGNPSLEGYLVLGIGTQTNNTPGPVTTFNGDPQSGEFSVTYNGTKYMGFLDTGSNGIFFPAPKSIPDCGAINVAFTGLLCPSSILPFAATNSGDSGTPQGAVSFQVGNFAELYKTNNKVFIEMAGSIPTLFDWGLPFHIGRFVYVGIAGKSSPIGTGPYWAY